ncbi:replication-relaxation family protein [Ornithinibacillus contaminans]|uniref:replication-relaxation family protein n=1 Tax=Ornithinibacillus contaminans TaxID=694055 RepID=UPI0012EE2CEC|nr:replication-relaxation family protein [Ornithinibacillus contaminans]
MEKEVTGFGVTEREFHILRDLYTYRAMTTTQIKKKYFPDTKQAVNYVLNKLRKRKMIKSNIFSGSRGRGKKGLSYHRITETGLECLIRYGMPVEGQIQNLYVKPSHLHYLLLANEVMAELTKAGWQVWDSRKTKKEFNMDQRMNIHGLLINPKGKQYGYYVMENNVLPQTLGKVIAEIRDNNDFIKNFIIFTRGKGSYDRFIDYALNPPDKREGKRIIQQKPLYTGSDLKLISLKMGLGLYSKYPTRDKWIQALAEHIGFHVISDISESGDNGIGDTGRNGTVKQPTRQSFPTIIRHNGEEKYFVDLTDTDLTLVSKINNYNEHSFKLENNRKVLVTTFNDKQKEVLNLYNQNIELLQFKAEDYFNELLT